MPVYYTQQRKNITCLKQKTNNNYYLSTTKNKELLPVYNTQQKRVITCLQHATKELLPVYNKQQRALLTVCSKQQRNNYYLSTTINKEELLPVYKKVELLPVYNMQQIKNYYLSTTNNKEE